MKLYFCALEKRRREKDLLGILSFAFPLASAKLMYVLSDVWKMTTSSKLETHDSDGVHLRRICRSLDS